MASPRGKQATAITDFLPGHTWVDGRLQSHALRADEIVTEIEIPFRPTRSAYVKFALRKSWDFAIASAAVSAVIQDGIWKDVRIVLGGVATSPYRSREAEDLCAASKSAKQGRPKLPRRLSNSPSRSK